MANRAVLVGINEYKMANSDLSGCVNDVTNVRDSLLKFFGFKIDDIRVITDERATKKAIMERLSWLVKGAKAGARSAWRKRSRDKRRFLTENAEEHYFFIAGEGPAMKNNSAVARCRYISPSESVPEGGGFREIVHLNDFLEEKVPLRSPRARAKRAREKSLKVYPNKDGAT